MSSSGEEAPAPPSVTGPSGHDEEAANADFLEFVVVVVLIGLAVGLLETFYSQFPVPPGVDPGDWIQRSYGWVGLAHPPVNAVGSPYLYPPSIFPILGGLRLATGSPEMTGFIFGGFVLATYGLTLWFLARVALRVRTHRIALVGFGVLNGTVVSMLFWGAYPNFFAFSFVDLTLAFAILFLRGPSVLRGLLLWGSAAATYLTHTLTFDLVLGVVVLTFLLAVVLGRFPWKSLFHRGNVIGVAVLAATVGAYTAVTDLLHIPHINYLFSNPPTFTLVGVGLVFTPLAKAPVLWPMGATIDLDPRVAAAILGVTGLAALGVGIWLAHRDPVRWDVATLLAGTWLGVMLLAPVGGYLVHVDTDYSRFVYFFPLPATLLALVVFEGALPRSLVPALHASRPPASAPLARQKWMRPRPFGVLSAGTVAVALALLVVNVTIPTMAIGEQGDAGTGHDAAFLAATGYLASNPTPGAVLTTQSAARWVEALTSRGAFDPGPTWLQFEPWEVSNAQESFFATNSATGVTNNVLVASYSGSATTSLSQAPMISALVLGVPIPIVRVLPASEATDSSGPGCAGWISASGNGTPTLQVPAASALSGEVSESNGCATTVQTTVLDPSAPVAWMNYTITPNPGDPLLGFNFTLASPPPRVVALHAGVTDSIEAVNGSLVWNVTTAVGQFPGGASVTLHAAVSPTPTMVVGNTSNGTGQAAYAFTNPDPSEPLSIALSFFVPGASNPAVVLPTLLSTSQFLATNSIRFLLLPSTALYAETIDFLSATFDFVTVFSNSEWTVLQSP
ncbi:MAG: hypothetical protein L3K16_06480 [Thermoplasmata archaeon]|nr:hypothetical protein [Thermoplasmata archaeon]